MYPAELELRERRAVALGETHTPRALSFRDERGFALARLSPRRRQRRAAFEEKKIKGRRGPREDRAPAERDTSAGSRAIYGHRRHNDADPFRTFPEFVGVPCAQTLAVFRGFDFFPCIANRWSQRFSQDGGRESGRTRERASMSHCSYKTIL